MLGQLGWAVLDKGNISEQNTSQPRRDLGSPHSGDISPSSEQREQLQASDDCKGTQSIHLSDSEVTDCRGNAVYIKAIKETIIVFSAFPYLKYVNVRPNEMSVLFFSGSIEGHNKPVSCSIAHPLHSQQHYTHVYVHSQ